MRNLVIILFAVFLATTQASAESSKLSGVSDDPQALRVSEWLSQCKSKSEVDQARCVSYLKGVVERSIDGMPSQGCADYLYRDNDRDAVVLALLKFMLDDIREVNSLGEPHPSFRRTVASAVPLHMVVFCAAESLRGPGEPSMIEKSRQQLAKARKAQK